MPPLLILFQSIQILLVAPISLWQTFTDKEVRRNHALEHATANVLEEKYGVKYVAGIAFKDGYKLFGRMPHPSVLVDAAREGLQRLKKGEKHLAVHPRCGTSLIVGQFIFALLFITVFLFLHAFSLLDLLLAIIISIMISRPLGLLVQKYFTTTTDVENIEFVDLSVDRWGQFYFRTRDLPYYRYKPLWVGRNI